MHDPKDSAKLQSATMATQTAMWNTLGSPSISCSFAGSATGGIDYVSDVGTIHSFAIGASAVVVTVPILDLALQTGTLTFFVDLSDESDGSIVAPSSAQVSIKDNGIYDHYNYAFSNKKHVKCTSVTRL